MYKDPDYPLHTLPPAAFAILHEAQIIATRFGGSQDAIKRHAKAPEQLNEQGISVFWTGHSTNILKTLFPLQTHSGDRHAPTMSAAIRACLASRRIKELLLSLDKRQILYTKRAKISEDYNMSSPLAPPTVDKKKKRESLAGIPQAKDHVVQAILGSLAAVSEASPLDTLAQSTDYTNVMLGIIIVLIIIVLALIMQNIKLKTQIRLPNMSADKFRKAGTIKHLVLPWLSPKEDIRIAVGRGVRRFVRDVQLSHDAASFRMKVRNRLVSPSNGPFLPPINPIISAGYITRGSMHKTLGHAHLDTLLDSTQVNIIL